MSNNRLNCICFAVALVVTLFAIAANVNGQQPLRGAPDLTVLVDGTPIEGGGGFSEGVPSYLNLIKVETGHLGSWVGTGSFLTDRLVLTCHHNVRGVRDGKDKVGIHTTTGRVYWDTKVVLVSPKLDLALIYIQDEAVEYHRTIAVADTVEPTGTVFAEGLHPAKNAVCQYEGTVRSQRYGDSSGLSPVYNSTTCKVVQGMSGGPLVDREGRLCGVNSASDGKMSLHTMVFRINWFLDQYKGPTGVFIDELVDPPNGDDTH